MNVPTMLNHFLPDVLSHMHKYRQQAVCAATLSAVKAQQVTVTGLGRGIKNHVHTKHNVKRMDRLIGNTHINDERIVSYQQLASKLLKGVKHPVILVDASYLNERQDWMTLRAAIVLGGRALPIYDEVHAQSEDNHPKMHRRFLRRLQMILPDDSQPILISDAGFRVPWFKKVEAMGWHWLGRLRNRTTYQTPGGQWMGCKTLYEQATHHPQFLGELVITKSNPISCFGALYKKPKKGRISKNLDGSRRVSGGNESSARREREPWLLVGNLPTHLANAAAMVGIYRLRMQIEEGFRDGKNHMLGFSLGQSGTRCMSRFEVLLLINALALWVCFWIGRVAYLQGWQRHFQANTVRNKRVLSYVYLGRELADHPAYQITKSMLRKALIDVNRRQHSWRALT